MHITVHEDKSALGRAAAAEGAAAIRAAIEAEGKASIIVATGASQFEVLDALIQEEIDWSKVTAFHLDEYVGVHADHPASFRGYLRDRFVNRIDGLKEFVPVDGSADDLDAAISALNGRIAQEEIAVCFAGIGENCHLAFNDPPADFEIETPFIVVTLDEACRRQQMGEGWFATLEDVPERAVSMSIHQIMKSKKLIISVPDQRKAKAVVAAVEGSVTVDAPASILQRHGACALHLDVDSASLRKPPAD
ncbi:6-phosphogluconolactonase [Oceaniovalibus sp. ACAM 378]|uniref:6-phosphogluconolactonase n=1 Tax=Oceaniovalibus sp. ACAM 378 TaxID=2599923 RepID=UPI0011D3418F|nr:6-phosphogluconolactonase [Oceaniovalibus sp. ACAM 378]TYB84526.1 glucosamine-6-phosphate deaminase [Oceaniovalibus sp. ACAM 378]